MSEQHVMNLGEIVDALRKMPPDSYTLTPLGGIEGVCSYRGFYDQLALVVGPRCMRVGDLLEQLERILAGETREGYKGGTYRYDRLVTVWLVTDFSATSDAGVVGIRRSDNEHCWIDIGWQRW